MRSIGQTISTQFAALDESVEDAVEDLGALKSKRHRAGKALEWLRDTEVVAAPRAAVVRPLVMELLREHNGLTYDKAYQLAREKLADAGVSAQGLGLRVREALTNPAVGSDDRGVFRLLPEAGSETRRIQLTTASEEALRRALTNRSIGGVGHPWYSATSQ